jgi:purine-binding chemotaxis protein CheW
MKVMTFSLADELYGLDIAAIQEIIEAPQRFFIPHAPECLQGVINFHGTITPVLDLARLLSLPEAAFDARVIVLRSDACALALAIHGLRTIVVATTEELIPCDDQREQDFCIQNILNHDNQMINILDLSKLLSRLNSL